MRSPRGKFQFPDGECAHRGESFSFRTGNAFTAGKVSVSGRGTRSPRGKFQFPDGECVHRGECFSFRKGKALTAGKVSVSVRGTRSPRRMFQFPYGARPLNIWSPQSVAISSNSVSQRTVLTSTSGGVHRLSVF